MTKFKCRNFFYIPPVISLQALLYYFNQSDSGQLPNDISLKDIFSLTSFLSNNNFDTSSNTYNGFNKIVLPTK